MFVLFCAVDIVPSEHGELVMNSCPVCLSQQAPLLFEKSIDVDHRVIDVMVCGSCLSILNSSAYARLAETQLSETQASGYEGTQSSSPEEYRRLIMSRSGLLGYFLQRQFAGTAFEAAADIGCGGGHFADVCATKYGHVYAVDFDHTAFHASHSFTNPPANVTLVHSLEEIPNNRLDLAVGWHVLEHIPAPKKFLSVLRDKLKAGGCFFAQIPGYRREYLVDSHFVFYNEQSLKALFESTGFHLREVGYDVGNSFITIIAQR